MRKRVKNSPPLMAVMSPELLSVTGLGCGEFAFPKPSCPISLLPQALTWVLGAATVTVMLLVALPAGAEAVSW